MASIFQLPRHIWTVDGHVHIEGQDGEVAVISAADALALSRLLNEAGSEALIKKIMGHP